MTMFYEIIENLVLKNLQEAQRIIAKFGPRLILAVLILIIGWVCAALFRKVISKILKALGFDIVSKKLGLKSFMERGGVVKEPSSIVGSIFYWLILFSALMMMFNAFNIEAASRLINETLLYLPKAAVSLILISLGIFLGRFTAEFIKTSARLAQIPLYILLGEVGRYIVIALAIMMALEHLGAAVSIITHYALIIFIVVPLLISLIFLVGGREVVSNILAGRFVIREFRIGDNIEFDLISGKIKSIDLIYTKIDSQGKEIAIPNSELLKRTIKKFI